MKKCGHYDTKLLSEYKKVHFMFLKVNTNTFLQYAIRMSLDKGITLVII